MPYQALARTWRPTRFTDVVGQSHIVTALSHALTQHKIHHAYLFTGTHGTGKTTIARIFAKCLNCKKGISSSPCDQCSYCKEIDAGCFPDLYEIDAASRTKVEDTRELLDHIPYAPTKGKYKIYLIDEVHMLSGHSFNALLKTLEEPPEHVKFLLATTDPQKLPATVLSRCLQFHLTKLSQTQIEKQLSAVLSAEKIHFENDALFCIAESANGSLRDALSLLDQCIAYGNGQIKTTEVRTMLGLTSRAEILELLKAIHAHDAKKALALTATWTTNGINFLQNLSDLLTNLYQISILQILDTTQHSELKNIANAISREDIQLYYQIALIGQRDLPLAPTAQIGFEMTVMRMMAFTPNHANVNTSASTPTPCNTVKQNTDWSALIAELQLSGPTLAFAQHCSLRSLTDNILHLTIQPKYVALLNVRHQERIQDAFIQKRSQVIKVKITVEEITAETPAERITRLQEAQKTSAKKEISADHGVQRIVKTFDATLFQDSIEPLT